MIISSVKSSLSKVLSELEIPADKLVFEHPADFNHGDYSTNIAMIEFSKVKDKLSGGMPTYSPLDLANKIVNKWREAGIPENIAKIDVVKPGFINIWLQNECLGKELERVIEENFSQGNTFDGGEAATSTPRSVKELATETLHHSRSHGLSSSACHLEGGGAVVANDGKKIMVEFAHPNTHKMFHIGHLRNITLGESICRILSAAGNQVFRVNYQGDIGPHVAKCLWGLLKGKNPATSIGNKVDLLGKAYALGSKAYESGEKTKAEIDEINKKLYEKSDGELLALWQKTRQWSLEYFETIYARLGTKFDRLFFETEVAMPGKEIVLNHLKRDDSGQARMTEGVFEESEGAVIFPGTKFGLHDRVFINSRGLPTYEAKDMALAQLQNKEFSPDLIIHLVGPEQIGYFQVIIKALEQISPEIAKKEFHLPYGWVRLKSGKMSSRTGDVVLGEWLIDEAKKRLVKKYPMPKEVAEQVAIGAVKYSLLKISPPTEIAFDIDESISLEGNSGPYLQYTYARTQGVINRHFGVSQGNTFDGGEATTSTPRSVRELASTKNLHHSRSHGLADSACHLEGGNSMQNDNGLGNRAQMSKFGQVSTDKLAEEETALLRTLHRFPEVVSQAGKNFAPNLICNYLFDLAQKYNYFYHRLPILNATTVDQKNLRIALTIGVGKIMKSGLELLGIEAPQKM